MDKIGFMFGAGAEIGYGLPSGGTFALDIFRQDSMKSKDIFRKQRDNLDTLGNYVQWLPEHYRLKSISVFKKRAFEDIIRGTVTHSHDTIINSLNSFDDFVSPITNNLSNENIDILRDFKAITNRDVFDCYMSDEITFNPLLKQGNNIFKSNYFSSLLLAYKTMKKKSCSEALELGKILLSTLQLQIGALGEDFVHSFNEGIFDRKDEEIDILDELGDILQLDYNSVGMSGLEYLLDMKRPSTDSPEKRILYFAQLVIEKIYSSVLDYKSLIDSNWMYLYYPRTEWAKFCKISIFLHNVRSYMLESLSVINSDKSGYYDDVYQATLDNRFEISTVATSNYLPIIEQRLKKSITYLNGSINMWYDPYLNRIGSQEELEQLHHFFVPLLFTQSGTKPMISIKMSSQYVNYYQGLLKSDKICIVGFGFNNDDEHINGLFRSLIDEHQKKMIIVTLDNGKSVDKVKYEIAKNLKITDTDNLSVVLVDKNRQVNGKSWTYSLLD